MAALPMASLVQPPLLDSAPFAHATVENYTPALVRIDIPEIRVPLGRGPRHDED